MLSRVADAIVWLHRSMERAGSLARFIDVTLSVTLDAADERESAWATLVRATGDDALFRERYGPPSEQNVLRFLTCDADYPHSIWSCVRAARENARGVRDVVSTELWEQVNRTYLWMGEIARAASPLEMPHAFCAEVKRAVHLFTGIADHSVAHDEAWHFGRIGRGLERADKTSRVVGVRSHLHLGPAAEPEQTASLEAPWVTALCCASGLEAYRQAHGAVVPAKAARFLLFERRFPYSVRHNVEAAHGSVLAAFGLEAERASAPPAAHLASVLSHLAAAERAPFDSAAAARAVELTQLALNAAGAALLDALFRPDDAEAADEPSRSRHASQVQGSTPQ